MLTLYTCCHSRKLIVSYYFDISGRVSCCENNNGKVDMTLAMVENGMGIRSSTLDPSLSRKYFLFDVDWTIYPKQYRSALP